MNPQKSTMSVLAQIASWIPDQIIDNLTKKHKIQMRVFSTNSPIRPMLYAHLAHSLSLNDICDSLDNHAGPLAQIRTGTPSEQERPLSRQQNPQCGHGRGVVLNGI